MNVAENRSERSHAHGRRHSPRTNPGQQRPVALRGGGEFSIAQRPSETVNGCGVMGVRVGVGPGEDLPLRGRLRQGGHDRPLVSMCGGTRRSGVADKTVTGLLDKLLTC